MATHQIHTSENKKSVVYYKNLIPRIKITEVRQIHIISFWVTLVLFVGFILLIMIDACK